MAVDPGGGGCHLPELDKGGLINFWYIHNGTSDLSISRLKGRPGPLLEDLSSAKHNSYAASNRV
jgi:hypothetical protein